MAPALGPGFVTGRGVDTSTLAALAAAAGAISTAEEDAARGADAGPIVAVAGAIEGAADPVSETLVISGIAVNGRMGED